MKKILLMLVSLLCATTQVWAAKVTDLSQLSNDKIYFLKSARAFLLYSEANPGMLSSSTGKTVGNVKEDITDPMQHFKILKDGESFYLFSVGAQKFVSDNGSLEDEPNTVLRITAVDNADYPWQLYLGANGMNSQSPNQTDTGILVNSWTYTDPGNCYYIEEARLAFDVEAAKKDAIAKLEEFKKGVEAFEIFSEDLKTIASAIYRIKHVTPYSDATEDLKNAIDRIEDIANETFDAVYDKTVCFTSYGRETILGQDLTINQDGANTAIKSGYAGLWKMKGKGDGTFTLYNFASDLYLGPTVGSSVRIPAKTSENEAGAYALRLHDIANQVVNLINNNNTLHVEGWYGNVVQWNDNNAGASQWKIELPDMAIVLEETKEKALNQLNEWNQSPLIYNATLIAEVKATIEAITETDINAMEAINAELEKITEELSSKYFTFRATSTDNHRNQVWMQASGNRAIGAHIENPDLYSAWKIKPAGGSSFYLYSEALNAYLGAPERDVNGDYVTDEFSALSITPNASYTFEIVDAANNIIEMHSGGQTLHASNHGDDKLLNWDGNEAASRWKIDIFDANGALDAVIAEHADKHAEVPALGQYPTAAYEELIAAKTEGRAIVAIINFQNSKNRPVYIITSAYDAGYPAGAAIYYDGEWKWKTADKYNRQMWMVINNYAEENVPVVDAYDANGTSYEICDYLTGTLMRGKKVQIVKIPDWEGAVNLQYDANASSIDAAQHAAGGGAVVNWIPATTTNNMASAWKVEYIGTSYELGLLSETYFQALNELKEMYNNIPDYEFRVGVNYYSEQQHGSLAAAKQQAEEVLAKEKATEEELLAAGKALRIALAQVSLNKPVEGKFYRLRCVDSDKYMQYTIADKKFHMLAGDEGKTHDATFCYYNSGLVSLQNALYMNLSRNEASYSRSLCKVYFTESSVLGQYNIELSERMLFGANDMIDSGAAVDNRAGYRWQLEEVTEIPVTISEAGYASFYATAAMELPAELEAYYVSYVGEDQVALEQIEGIIPDGAAVLLKGEAGEYNLTVVNEKTTEIKDNKLKGVVVSKYIAGDAYVLAADDAALIKAELNRNGNGEAVENGTHFLANGFSAYLPVADAIQDVLTFNFDGSITGVTLVPETNNANAAIYDLSGRRVEKATKGIYIVNGKKMIIK